MEEKVSVIKQRLAEASDRQKSYAYSKWVPRHFSVGEKVFLRVNPQNSSIKFGK